MPEPVAPLPRPVEARRRPPTGRWWSTRAVRPTGWWPDVLLLVGMVVVTGALAAGRLLDLDLAVRDWADANRPPAAYWVARVVNYLGQGGQVLIPVAGLLALLLARRVRSVRPLLPVVAATAATYLTVGAMKVLLPRAYPHDPDDPFPERLFTAAEPATAYPSGHVVNTVIWYAVIALLITGLLRAYGRPVRSARPFPGYWTLRVLPVVVVFCSTTYLGFHWLTDSVTGLLLGLLLARLLGRVVWDEIRLPALPHGLDRRAGLS
ncbi:phosphatase PAP2 family protein [Solwaraspora sp. WMMD406]|uniref:phosphatase PAP2 family protein n=1 Tax=Solwaraspora sp. WMMD406 TaxID=3016095 RepID=UPI00241618F3|nr:phosphatase PAP2 family protein [Solwaraspora sp. WMMD406]MDG4768313.1 phosphatase PAP2 family protein [Solwaraspora sp. WMMD406]